MRLRPAMVAVVALVLVVRGPGPSGAAHDFPDQASAGSAREGAKYLVTVPGAHGSGPEEERWRVDQVAETTIALVAGGGQDATVERALDYIATHAAAFLDPVDGEANGPRVGRVVSGLVAAGRNPRDFGGIDWVARLELYYVPGSGTYGGENFYADTLAMLGVLAAGEALPIGAVERVQVNQCDDEDHPARDGGWTWQASCLGAPDTDTTAMATSVLVATLGADAPEVREAREWLLHTQRDTGCWGLNPTSSFDNTNSCGLAVSAVVALAEDPRRAQWADGEDDPVSRLRSLQLPSGGFKYRAASAGANPYATVQAVPGLAAWSYPVSAAMTERSAGHDGTGGGGGNGSTTTSPGASGGGEGIGESAGGRGSGEPSTSTAGDRDDSPTSPGSARPPDRDESEPPRRRDEPRNPPPSEMKNDARRRSPAAASHDGVNTGSASSPEMTIRLADPASDDVGIAGVVATGAFVPVAATTGWWWRRRIHGAQLIPWLR